MRPAPAAWSAGWAEIGQGMGLVACLEPSQRQWPGTANLRPEWMSDHPRLPEDLIAARPEQKLSIQCLDSG